MGKTVIKLKLLLYKKYDCLKKGCSRPLLAAFVAVVLAQPLSALKSFYPSRESGDYLEQCFPALE